MEGGKDLDASFETMWIIKQQDLKMKERVSKMRLLERLLAKEEPLADYEEALKKQLSIELMMDRLKIMVHCKVWTSHGRVYCGRVTDLKSHGFLSTLLLV
ncbi:hypothetical protein YC2023_090406 [Brassica napus]